MPSRQHYCTWPGCRTRVTKGRCPEHATSTSGTSGYSAREWVELSKSIRQQRTVCECRGCPRCTPTRGACRRRSAHVDHIDGRGLTGPRAYDPANLRPLCHPCHSHKTATSPGAFGRPNRR